MSVSVIIPTFNRAQLVQETIESVLNQSYKDYEIIVIDDGSTDNTEQQLRRFKNKIIYVKQENRGLNASRNRALTLASGKYIALLDSDDLWLDFKLELETSILDRYSDCGFVFSDFYILKPGNIRIPNGLHTWFSGTPQWGDIFESNAKFVPEVKSEELDPNTIDLFFGDIYHVSLFGPRVLPSASLFRKSMVDGYLDFNEKDTACGDWEFFAKLSHTHPPVFIDIETALNRSHEDAVRVTRIDHKIQLSQRIAMIERTWKQDTRFYSSHNKETDTELTRLYYQLLKYQLFDGYPEAAKISLREIDKINSNALTFKLMLYKMAAYFPGLSYLIKRIRQLVHAAR